jgi:hypothetical protein
MILDVIWSKLFEFENLGGSATVLRRITAGQQTTWALASRRAASTFFSRTPAGQPEFVCHPAATSSSLAIYLRTFRRRRRFFIFPPPSPSSTSPVKFTVT